jgi:hypothetical protein
MMLFRRIGSVLLFMAVLAAPALAGVNTGGILVAHDASLLTSATDGAVPIAQQGSAPTGCADVDARINGATSQGAAALFKVYAIFPQGSSPRLKGVAWGVHYGATTSLEKGWNCGDFELPDADWPGSDQGNSVTFDAVHTGLVIPIYVFSAYTDGTAGTVDLAANPSQGAVFGDDTVPAALDVIAGLGKIGFDTDGTVPPCGGYPGACCDRVLATCSLKSAGECGTSNIFIGPNTTCTPYPCGTGACCIPGAPPSCQDVATPDACVALGGFYRGLATVCAAPYNDCVPYGACCSGSTCVTTVSESCVSPSVFIQYQPCAPGLCRDGLGACCVQTNCSQTIESECTGVFWPATSCQVNVTCSGSPGACCSPTGCVISQQQTCTQDATTFFLANVDCNPDPCPGLGACCTYDTPVRCTMTTEGQCATVWKLGQTCEPNVCATLGACCQNVDCSITLSAECASPRIWAGNLSCTPIPEVCTSPVSKTTWGQIKNTYKDARR